MNPNPWDINLAAEHAFLENDYLYISKQSLLGLKNAEIESARPRQNISGENTANVLDFYNRDFGNYHLSSEVLGPSFSVAAKVKEKRFVVGLFTRLRTQSAALEVDNYLKFSNQRLTEPEIYTLQPLEFNLMNWAELGFNFSTELFPYSDYQWIIGGNIKYEVGLDAAMVRSTSPLQLVRTSETIDGTNSKTITAYNFNLETSFATNYNFETSSYELKPQGKGLGIDFGIAVVDNREEIGDYRFKAAINILDVGKINFSGENHRFNGQQLVVVNNPNIENTRLESPQKIMRLLSEEVYGDESASFQGTDFSIGLPTSVHINLSLGLGSDRFIHTDWIQRVPVFDNSLRRSNLFSASYSVQKPALGYGASASLYEYRAFHVGGYLRIGPLLLGSQNVLPLFMNQKKLHPADFYVALKLYPFWDTEFKRHRRANCYCD